ncbi:4Fe-4S ferredoxin [bacterium]|nr:MAG: 4Fe-4S ferredoxin [bacterium]
MPEEEKVPVYIMNKRYMVPASLTIMGALEYAGYQLKRGCGCREGFCGACATVYRVPGSYKVQYGLACQSVVEPDMYIAQLPFFPAVKKTYDIEKLKPENDTLITIYPEIGRCVACNTCTKSCPQDLEVMDYIQAALRGDIEKVAHLSFDCIMCGLCAARCPAEIVHYNVGILARRLYGKYLNPKSKHLEDRLEDIEKGKFDAELEELKNMSREELEKTYIARDLDFKIT